MAKDTFPGLQQDCLDLGKKISKLQIAVRACRAACVMGDAENVRLWCIEIAKIGTEIGSSAEDFEILTHHFIVYEDDEKEC